MKTRREIITGGLATIGLTLISKAFPVRSMLGAEGAKQIQDSEEQISALSYIQNGLYSQWDGIENAGYGFHNPEATEWTDLKGNANIRSLSFGDDYVVPMSGGNPYTDGRLSYYRINGDFTLHGCIITCPLAWYNWTMLGIGSGSGLENGFCFCGRQNGSGGGKICYRKAYSGTVLNSINTGIGTSQFCTMDILFSYDTKTYAVCIDGQYIGERTILEENWNLDGVNVSIGCSFYRVDLLGDYRLYDILYYKRLLSQDEISYNNLIDRYRFLRSNEYGKGK